MTSNFEYYKIFYYVAKYGNFTQAANVLMSNQPNLTRAVKNLEAELGCPIRYVSVGAERDAIIVR